MSTVTSVSSSALHLLSAPKDKTAAVVLAAMLAKVDVTSLVLQQTTGTINHKMKSAFNYADSTYTLDLPSGRSTQLTSPTRAEIEATIALDISYPLGVVVNTFRYQPFQAYFDVLDYLVPNRQANVIAGTIGSFPGLSFSNGQKMYITGSSLSSDNLRVLMTYEYWGYAESQYSDEGNSYTKVEWQKISDHSESIVRSNPVPMVLLDNCLVTEYVKLDGNGNPLPTLYNWIYRTATDTYPDLNNVASTPQLDKYFPVVPIRYNNVDFTDPSRQATPLYQTSRRLLTILDLPFEKLGEKINASPDIASIDHAYVMFGADVQSNVPSTLAYLNQYFDYIGSLNTTIYGVSIVNVFNDNDMSNSSFNEHGLSLKLHFDSITTTTIPGKIDDGKIGNARKTIIVNDLRTEEGNVCDDSLILDLQITKTLIRRVTIKNLIVKNYVDGHYTVDTRLRDIKADPGNHNMIIPLEYNFSLNISYRDRISLYADCVLLVINAVDKRKLKWYEEGWFTAVVMIVAFVIICWTGQAWIVGLVEAMEVGILAVTMYLALTVLTTIAVSVVATWVIKTYGTKIGIIGAIVVAVLAMCIDVKVGINLLSQYTLSYAQLALSMATALINAADKTIQAEINKLATSYEAFTELLKDAYTAMETNPEVKKLSFESEFDLMAAAKLKDYYSVPNEYADEFFERTLELPYATTYGIHGAIPNFVDNLLTIDNSTIVLAY